MRRFNEGVKWWDRVGCRIKYATPCGPFRRPLISISNEPLYRCFSHDFTSLFTPRRPLMAVIFIIKGGLSLLILSPSERHSLLHSHHHE